MKNVYQSITEGEIWDYVYSLDNYKIIYSTPCDSAPPICAIYFSSSGIYFPNTEEELYKNIVESDKYEWYNHKIKRASKHIFIRDVSKNFYVVGINKKINTIDKIAEFLKIETNGYDVVTVGSSGGAYAAALLGSILGAKEVYSFSCFWDLNQVSNDVWHLIAKYSIFSDYNKFYELYKVVQKYSDTKILYIYPANNYDEINNDILQSKLVENISNVYIIPMASQKHGVCIEDSYLLNKLLNITSERFKNMDAPVSEKELAKKMLSHHEYFMYIIVSLCERYTTRLRKLKTKLYFITKNFRKNK